jgi:hypothetical protein
MYGGCTPFDLDAFISFRFIGGWIYAYHQNKLAMLFRQVLCFITKLFHIIRRIKS